MRGGFGGKGGSISSRSIGKQDVSDRASNSENLIRSIAGGDLALWLDANDITGIAEAGQISSWTAKHGNNAPQSNSDYQPTYRGSGFNGRPSVRFDGTDDHFQYSTAGIQSTNQMENTIISVSRHNDATSGGVVLELGAAFWASDGISQQYAPAVPGTASLQLSGIGQDPGNDPQIISNEKLESELNVLISTFDRNTNPDTVVNYLNAVSGSDPVVNTIADTTAATNWNGLTTQIGCRRNATPSLPLDGDIRELVVINRAVTKGEAFRLGKAFMERSGITKPFGSYTKYS